MNAGFAGLRCVKNIHFNLRDVCGVEKVCTMKTVVIMTNEYV